MYYIKCICLHNHNNFNLQKYIIYKINFNIIVQLNLKYARYWNDMVS